MDLKNEIKIPQNSKSFYIIKKSEEWENCIDIKIKPKEEINLTNLFLIIKSYIKNTEFFCYKISSIILKHEEKDFFVTENIQFSEISNQNINEFKEWWLTKITYDSKYITKNEDLYAFRVSFQKNIITNLNKKYKTNTLEYLKPKYPWKEELLDEQKLEIDTIEKLKNKIKKLKKEIKELKGKN